jgi:hypothetical protein
MQKKGVPKGIMEEMITGKMFPTILACLCDSHNVTALRLKSLGFLPLVVAVERHLAHQRPWRTLDGRELN